ncbi:MAG: hypothetical protein OJF51_002907 [Nitrospira sp.]|nr:MAG: hypothetical protein OJF51_002907 [Nitrospira sp.]
MSRLEWLELFDPHLKDELRVYKMIWRVFRRYMDCRPVDSCGVRQAEAPDSSLPVTVTADLSSLSRIIKLRFPHASQKIYPLGYWDTITPGASYERVIHKYKSRTGDG